MIKSAINTFLGDFCHNITLFVVTFCRKVTLFVATLQIIPRKLHSSTM